MLKRSDVHEEREARRFKCEHCEPTHTTRTRTRRFARFQGDDSTPQNRTHRRGLVSVLWVGSQWSHLRTPKMTSFVFKKAHRYNVALQNRIGTAAGASGGIGVADAAAGQGRAGFSTLGLGPRPSPAAASALSKIDSTRTPTPLPSSTQLDQDDSKTIGAISGGHARHSQTRSFCSKDRRARA